MTTPAPTAHEFHSLFRLARFRPGTFMRLLELLPDIEQDVLAEFPSDHRDIVEAIAGAERAVTLTARTEDYVETDEVQWFSGPTAIVECCLHRGEILALTWPADDAILAARIAISIGFRNDDVGQWLIPTERGSERIRLTHDDGQDLVAGRVPDSVRASVGPVVSVVQLWSTMAQDAPPEIAYYTTIVLTENGPWVFDPGDEPWLRRLHPALIWHEIGMLMTGFDSEFAHSGGVS